MDRFDQGPPALSSQAGAVLMAIANDPDPLGLRLNDLSGVTGLPTGHVGRHLRTLENDRLASFGAGRWRATLRGRRIAADIAALPVDPAPPLVA
jgi:DNA-binding IclR family transcriptional regulator